MSEIGDELEAIAKAAADLERRSAELLEPQPRGRMLPVSIQRESANRKLAPQDQVVANNGRIRNEPAGPFVVSTHVSIQATCPDSCAFKAGGCYAEAGLAHLTLRRLDAGARGWDPREVSMLEARMIDALWRDRIPQDGARGGRDLRLHVAGDVADTAGARALADAAARWRERGGGAVWTYTHRWREIPASAWAPISVLASVESVGDARAALERGYTPAMVVDRFDGPQVIALAEDLGLVPCPAEAGRLTCAQCRLCMNADKLRARRPRRLGIAFALHGSGAGLVQLRP